MPRAFVLGAAALCRAAGGAVAPHRVLFMHVTLFECITCVRVHRPRRASAGCSDSCRAAGATGAMRDTLILAWCCVVRVLGVVRVAGASSSPPWTCSRCGWRDCDPAAGALPDTRTVGPLPSPKYPISVRRDGGGCVWVCGHRFLTPGRTFTVKGFAR